MHHVPDCKRTYLKQEIILNTETNKFIPLFRCCRFGDNGWMFHCPFCRRSHYHLAVEGFKQAQCTKYSPFKNRGYYLVQKETEGVS